MLDWDDLRYFLALHRHGTLLAAGAALQINPTTVGRRITALEQRMGARLFDKTSDGYSLTATGQQLVSSAERMESEVLTLERKVIGADARPSGIVRLALTEMLATRFVAHALARFRDRYPGITLDLACSNKPVNLTAREADVALRLARTSEPDVIAKRLASIHLALYASREYLNAFGAPENPERSLAGLHIAAFADTRAFARENEWLHARLDGARIVLRSDSVSSLYAAAVEGAAIALLPRGVADNDPGLVRIETQTAPEPRVIWQLVHKDLATSARVRAVVEFLREELTEPVVANVPKTAASANGT